MQKLLELGFTYGVPPAEHTALSARKTFGVLDSEFVSRKPYLQCLLALKDLKKRGLLRVSSGEAVNYYKCILKNKSPASVPKAATHEVYKQLLGSTPVDECTAFLDPQVEAVEDVDADAGVDEDEQVEVLSPLRKRARRGRVSEPRLRLLPPQLDDSSSDAEASDNDNAFIETETTQFMVEGARVYKETHLKLGDPGHYVRFGVRCCQHPRPGNQVCGRKRNLGAEQRLLGEHAPVAYLGVFLKKAHEFADAEDHIRRCKPTPAEVQEYMVQHNLN